jgi:hypothetical protein
MSEEWYRHSYRRNLVDMHIADWDEHFLSQFDPETYVATVCRAQPTAAMVYAHSHVGHCYYPTQIGHQHASLHGRNIFGDVIDGFHRRGVDVIAYFSLIYDACAYHKNPQWRITLANGDGAAEHSRYGVCCPNSPYRDYAAAHVAELCTMFQFEGIFLDMTFWPAVCYCPYCAQRFAAEVGGPLPRVINWEDPLWVAFQRRREAWLVEFAQHVTATIRRVAPQVSIQHQASTYLHNWRFGVTADLAEANTYLGGDFYGDALQGSIVRKLFHNLSPNLPLEFMTSFSINLQNHTARKSKDLLQAKASACIADGAAFLFIDAIDPVGTLNPATYERMRSVFDKTTQYERYLGGDLRQDVAIYASTESKHDPADNGKPVDDQHLSTAAPHVDGITSTARALIAAHVPYGVITRSDLGRLNRHKVIILPNVLALSPAEAEALRAYVHGGGNLYASKHTSLITTDGIRHADFLLADVFGVSYVGETPETYTYIAPIAGEEDNFAGYSAKWPLAFDQNQVVVRAHRDAQVLAHTVLPYTDPRNTQRFASIHSNPPGIATSYPAVVLHRFGQGQALFVTAALESSAIHSDTLLNLIRRLGGRFSVESDAPQAVEVTTFHQPAQRRYLISLVNFQKDLPNIPVPDIHLRVQLGGRRVQRVLLLPEETALPYAISSDRYVEFTAPVLQTLHMFALDYEE